MNKTSAASSWALHTSHLCCQSLSSVPGVSPSSPLPPVHLWPVQQRPGGCRSLLSSPAAGYMQTTDILLHTYTLCRTCSCIVVQSRFRLQSAMAKAIKYTNTPIILCMPTPVVTHVFEFLQLCCNIRVSYSYQTKHITRSKKPSCTVQFV